MTATDVNAKWGKDGSLIAPRTINVDLDSSRSIAEQIDTPENRAAIGEVVGRALGIKTMTMDATTLLAAIKRVEHAASRSDEQSLILQCIHVTHGLATAADNYRISRSAFQCEPCDGEFLVHVTDLPVLAAWLDTIPAGTSVSVSIAEEMLTFESGRAMLTVRHMLAKYPNVDAVLPSEDAPYEIALNAGYLADIKKLGKGVLRIGLWGSQRGVLFTLVTEDTEVSEFIQPVRSPDIPEWGKPPDRAVDPDTGELRS